MKKHIKFLIIAVAALVCAAALSACVSGSSFWKRGKNSQPQTYTVTLPTGTGYTAAPAYGETLSVTSGASFDFTVTLSTGYTQSAVIVWANGDALTAYGKIYTISNVARDVTVTVEGVTLNTYTVTLPGNGTAYTAAPASGYGTTAKYGGDFKFTVALSAGYSQSDITVSANGVVLTPADGVYTISGIAANQTVTVGGVVLNSYTVTLPQGTGYAAAPAGGYGATANYGGSYKFTVTLADEYGQCAITVKANGAVLTAAGGVYAISNITADQTVTVEGL